MYWPRLRICSGPCNCVELLLPTVSHRGQRFLTRRQLAQSKGREGNEETVEKSHDPAAVRAVSAAFTGAHMLPAALMDSEPTQSILNLHIERRLPASAAWNVQWNVPTVLCMPLILIFAHLCYMNCLCRFLLRRCLPRQSKVKLADRLCLNTIHAVISQPATSCIPIYSNHCRNLGRQK